MHISSVRPKLPCEHRIFLEYTFALTTQFHNHAFKLNINWPSAIVLSTFTWKSGRKYDFWLHFPLSSIVFAYVDNFVTSGSYQQHRAGLCTQKQLPGYLPNLARGFACYRQLFMCCSCLVYIPVDGSSEVNQSQSGCIKSCAYHLWHYLSDWLKPHSEPIDNVFLCVLVNGSINLTCLISVAE
jgi:hypothetical protein